MRSAFLTGNLLMVIVTVIFGLELPIQKLLIPHEMSAVQVSASRLVGGAVLFWLAALFLKKEKIQRGDWKDLIIAGVVCQFGFMFFYTLAIDYTSVIDVALILTSQPIMIILLDHWLHKNAVSRMEIVGVVIALAGAIFVIIAGGSKSSAHASDPVLGSLMAVGCSVCYSFYISLTRHASDTYKSWTVNKWLFLFAAIPAIPFLFGLPGSNLFRSPNWAGAGEIAFVILLASFACYFMIPPSIKRIGSDLVGIYSYLTPVVAAIIAIAMKVDVLKWQQPVAFAVIIGGVVLITIAKKKLEKEAAAEKNAVGGKKVLAGQEK